jgi:hypothetical protein
MGARWFTLTLLLAACSDAGKPPAVPVTGASRLRLEADPGPPPAESPPPKTLWARDGDAWRRVDRVLGVAPGGRAWVDAARRLVVDGRPVADGALPGLSLASDGTVFFARSSMPPDSDVWKVAPGGTPVQVTRDGRSDRPFALPDGSLLWISSAPDGVAGWVRDGRKITRGLAIPVPAYPDRTRLEGGLVVYDAGDGEWALDPSTGEARRR